MAQHDAIKAGNVAVITGAGDGIGLAAARYFQSAGMVVCLADINTQALSRWHPDYADSFEAFMNYPPE